MNTDSTRVEVKEGTIEVGPESGAAKKSFQVVLWVTLGIVALIISVASYWIDWEKWFDMERSGSHSKWDGEIVLNQVGQPSEVISWEAYHTFEWKIIKGSAETYEAWDAKHPENRKAFTKKTDSVNLGTNIFDIQFKVLSGPERLPVVIGYRKRTP